MVSLVISGFGTVGQGVAEVLLRRKEFLTGRYGAMPKASWTPRPWRRTPRDST